MSIVYNGVHSIDFFNLSEEEPLCRNSWEDFHIVPASRPYVALPQYNLMAANVPLTCRRIDLTSSFGKTIASQSGQWEFYIDYDEWEDWASCYRALVNYFHGFKMAVRLKDHEHDRLYVGRFVVQNYAPENDYSKITIEYYLEPTAETDPLALNLHFQVWWLDWDRRPISYETITWYAHPSSTTSEGTGYTGGKDHDNQKLTPDYPVKISITKLPSKLSYNDGDTINYSGISVTAYNSRGTIWSANSRYLSGLIPYSELVFPVSIATVGSATSEAFPVSQLLPVQWSRPDDHKVLSSAFSVAVMSALPYGTGADNLIMRTYTAYANDKISYIDDYAFYSYSRLGSLYLLSNKVATLNNSNALYQAYTHTYVPESLYSAYKADNIWSDIGGLISYSLSKENSTSGEDLEMELKFIARTPSKWINNTVSYIASYAFTSYYSLVDVSFGNCKSIGGMAFYKCSSLVSANFPMCDYIGYDAFSGCSSLTSISFPVCSYIGNSAFYNCSSLVEANFPVCSYIGLSTFLGCSSLVSISFPVCSYIEFNAFSDCTSLTEAYFPMCSTISTGAFARCTSLMRVSFPLCSTIGVGAFGRCTSLTDVNIPLCAHIDNGAFSGCISLVEADFTVCSYVGSYAFRSCSSLTSISFPVCSYIGNSAFYKCSSLVEANFPVCSYIGNSAFYSCTSLAEINFPVCSRIGSSAFYDCSSLTEAIFPACSYIGVNAFIGCQSLRKLLIGGSVVVSFPYLPTPFSTKSVWHPETSSYTYEPANGSFWGSIYVPGSLLGAYQTAPRWSAYSSRFTAI